jgi:hypothetical protein
VPFDATTYVTDNVLRILERAHQLLSKRGAWVKHVYQSGDGKKFCILGALDRASVDIGWDVSSSMTARGYVKCVLPPRYVSVPVFNDAPQTTRKVMLSVLTRAIEARRHYVDTN